MAMGEVISRFGAAGLKSNELAEAAEMKEYASVAMGGKGYEAHLKRNKSEAALVRDVHGNRIREDYSAADSAEAAASPARFANHRFRNGFSTNKARNAEIKSNTIAMLKTPDHPIFGNTILAENGIGISVTVRTRP